MSVFVEEGKPENPEKNPRSKDENQQQTQPTYDVESGNRTRATLVGGKGSQHCAIPAPQILVSIEGRMLVLAVTWYFRNPVLEWREGKSRLSTMKVNYDVMYPIITSKNGDTDHDCRKIKIEHEIIYEPV